MSAVLEKLPEHQTFTDNSVTKCKSHCADLEYGMSGAFIAECYCWLQRDEYLSAKGVMSFCSKECPGNASESCGNDIALKYVYVADTDFPSLHASIMTADNG